MSLVDFDDDASFHTTTSAPTASFNGHNSIDDPFGFNVFGTGSTGTKVRQDYRIMCIVHVRLDRSS